MREKNGFIATSVLYSFLLAFLTLFLAFVANYLQNKQLLARVEDIAKYSLDNYGNMSISKMSIGDYTIFDTIDPEALSADQIVYRSPISGSARWILYSKAQDPTDSEYITYSFVSDSYAQNQSFVAATGTFGDGGQAQSTGEKDPEELKGSLFNISSIINGNVYYNVNTHKYKGFTDQEVRNGIDSRYSKVFVYQYPMHNIEGVKVDVQLLNSTHLDKIFSIVNPKIRGSIMDQDGNYVFWYDESSDAKQGFVTMEKITFTNGLYTDGDTSTLDGTDLEVVNNNCKFRDGTPATIVDDKITYNSSKFSFGSVANGYVDFCYKATKFAGKCLDFDMNTSWIDRLFEYISLSDRTNYCKNMMNPPPRFVLTVSIKKDSDSDVYIDSGNGTKQYPYLVTTGRSKNR